MLVNEITKWLILQKDRGNLKTMTLNIHTTHLRTIWFYLLFLAGNVSNLAMPFAVKNSTLAFLI